ncbi:MAG: hypothetical protein V1897_16280, partial [Pseudomonadota bacterium]
NVNLMLYGLILLLCIIDIMTPKGIAMGVLYAIPILLSLFYRTRLGQFTLAFVCSSLIIIGYFLSPSGEDVFYSLINRILALIVIWITALFVSQWNLLEGKREKARQEIKVLRGLLPICSSCKKIRGDEGYWHHVEEYISDHSEALFSHGICPDCMRKLYPDLADKVLSRLEEDKKE